MQEKIKKEDIKNNNNDILSTFNNRYNTELSINSYFLDISQKDLDNEGLQLFSELPLNLFECVIELNLSQNCISDISPLIRINLSNLKKLNLSKNRIENIDVFEKLNLNDLEDLNLSNNKLKNINSLAKLNLFNLANLNLSDNRINDITALEFMNCPNLRSIDVFNNEILDITVFERVSFPQLNQISCAGNFFNHEIIKNYDIISNLRKRGCNVNIYGTIKQIL